MIFLNLPLCVILAGCTAGYSVGPELVHYRGVVLHGECLTSPFLSVFWGTVWKEIGWGGGGNMLVCTACIAASPQTSSAIIRKGQFKPELLYIVEEDSSTFGTRYSPWLFISPPIRPYWSSICNSFTDFLLSRVETHMYIQLKCFLGWRF